MTPAERARLEVLEERIEQLAAAVLPPTSIVTLGGDVVGPSNNNALAKILALAGGGNRFVGVDNAGDIVAAPTVLPLNGDTTGTTAASVLSKIAALGGSGTVAVFVNNAGNVVSGGTPAIPIPSATYSSTTQNIAPSATVNFDTDLVAFTDCAVLIEAKIIATTKGATAHLIGVAWMWADAVFENRNGVPQLAKNANGGPSNPMNTTPQMLTIHPESCDNALESGGGTAMNASWGLAGVGAPTSVRLTVTNQNNTNTARTTVILTITVIAAP